MDALVEIAIATGVVALVCAGIEISIRLYKTSTASTCEYVYEYRVEYDRTLYGASTAHFRVPFGDASEADRQAALLLDDIQRSAREKLGDNYDPNRLVISAVRVSPESNADPNTKDTAP